jgi:hypothetical protein
MIAGVLISIAMFFFGTVENKLFGAAVFSFALLFIKEQGFALFTGRAGTGIKGTWYKTLPLNLIGVAAVAFALMPLCSESFYIIAYKITSDSILNIVIKGLVCGALMRVACTTKEKLITIGCVIAFLISGFYHSIAVSFTLITTGITLQKAGILALLIVTNALGAKIAQLLMNADGDMKSLLKLESYIGKNGTKKNG